MTYFFRVQGALIAGIQAIPVQVECAQSRRLPYIHIIGGSRSAVSELRERVIAAVDACKLRLPARRITVQIQPGVHGLPLEQLDLAVAVALLGSSGLIPPACVEGRLICGNLGLDGSIRPSLNAAALRRLLSGNSYRSALLPWEGSEVLSEPQLEWGGGFHHLLDVVEFLRGTAVGRRANRDPERSAPPPGLIWNRIEGQEVAKRMLEIAAAGAHHVLLPGPASARPDLLAHALSSLLPPLTEEESEEVSAIYALAGMKHLQPTRPFFSFGSSMGLPPLLPDRRLARVEEFLLAHRGVFYVDQICEREPVLFPDLLPPMLSGKMQARIGSRRIEIPADAIVVASSPACGCGSRGDDRLVCTCRPTEARRYQERWKRLLRYPFDLCLPILPASAAESSSLPWASIAERVQSARERMRARQGMGNGRLGETEVFAAKPWRERPAKLWKVFEARQPGSRVRLVSMAKVALTLSDLRGGEAVEDHDLFEARHYFSVFTGAPGSKAASSSLPDMNSSATP